MQLSSISGHLLHTTLSAAALKVLAHLALRWRIVHTSLNLPLTPLCRSHTLAAAAATVFLEYETATEEAMAMVAVSKLRSSPVGLGVRMVGGGGAHSLNASYGGKSALAWTHVAFVGTGCVG